MPYELQLKPFERKDGQNYKILDITDITLHSNNLRPTQNVGKKLVETMENNEPGRIYSKIEKREDNSYELLVTLLKKDPELIEMLQEEEKKGYKVLLRYPKDGIPMLAGKDTIDFMHSIKGKRILRRLYKQKGEEYNIGIA